MAFSVSPSVEVREFDASLVVPNVSSMIVGTVGAFQWGPCFKRTQITSEMELRSFFGLPNDTVYKHWFSVAEFLRYSANLYVVRAVDAETAKNAGIGVQSEEESSATAAISTNPYIPNLESIPTISFGASEKLQFVAKYPGALGNTKIKVALASADDFATATIDGTTTFVSEFEYAPVSNTYDKYDQVAIAVLVKNDLDNNWQIAERFVVDLDPEAKNEYNQSNYIENVINYKSNYIYAFDNTTIAYSPKSFEATFLAGGVDGSPDSGDIQLGYDYFNNPEEFDVRVLIDGGNNDATTHSYIISIVESRLDCIAILSVPQEEMVNITLSTAVANCVTYRTTTLNQNSTYAALYANAKYIYDKFNDVYRWIPISGDIAGIMAETARTTEQWYAPAGYNRGIIRNGLKLAINPTKAYRDTLYHNTINPITGTPGDGMVVLGQKTLKNIPSAFNRINVRMLFINLEKAIATAAKYMMFEFNDDYQRNLFKLMVTPYLKNIQGRRGITDFTVICDTTNNPGSVIDNNGFVGDIYIKPSRVAEFIQLNFTAVATDVNFNEIVRPDLG